MTIAILAAEETRFVLPHAVEMIWGSIAFFILFGFLGWKAWPAVTALAPASVFSPRIGRRRRFSCPWSASTRLFAYRSVRCHAAGSSSSSTLGYTVALSVTTSTGVTLVDSVARWKNRRAAPASRREETYTSTT